MFVEYRKPIVCSKREKGKDENTVICRFSRRRFPPFNRLSFWFLPVYSRMSANRFWQDSSSDSSSDYSYSSSDYEEEEVPRTTATKSKYVVISSDESEEEKRVVKTPKLVCLNKRNL